MLRLSVILILIISVNIVNISISNANVIRDSEIEEAIELIIKPLKEASGLDRLKIYIVNDLSPNAFTAGGDTIFIHSGLIIKYPDPDILRGVIAHEMGHILGFHVVRQNDIISNYQKSAIAAMSLGIVAAMNSQSEIGAAILFAGNHVASRSILSYSRVLESSADQVALKLLHKSSHSAVGIIDFLQRVNDFNAHGSVNPYTQTHPLNNNRLLILNSFHKRSPFQSSQNTETLITKYQRSSAKLAAFTLDLDQILDYPSRDQDIVHYLKAIRCFRMGDFDNALNHINHLIMSYPDDPFYHEFKAQLYFSYGKKGALSEYENAVSARPNDVLIRLGKAITGITQYINNQRYITRFYKDLSFVINHEPDNLLALHYLSKYYDVRGDIGKSALNSAVILSKIGRMDDAVQMTKHALQHIKSRSTDWYKAQDILQMQKQ